MSNGTNEPGTEGLRELRADIINHTRGPHQDHLDAVSASSLRMVFNDVAPPELRITGDDDEGLAGVPAVV